jgi:NitT/TauT family transport system substrate-binding protein
MRAEGIKRRDFLRGLGAAAGLHGLGTEALADEPPPETTRIRLLRRPTLCEAPQYVAEELLQAEGFRDIQYVKRDLGAAEDALGTGEADISMLFGAPMILRVDAGEPVVFLAGVHVGCIELFATDRVRTAADLKGRTIPIPAFRAGAHVFIASIAAHVGLKPDKDINWVVQPTADWPRLLIEGKIDALMAFPPATQELRAKRVGRVILSTLSDRPWSQYFCCMIVGNRNFVRRHPIATKRAMRAILKASDMCALQPERVAQFLIDRGYVERSDYAAQAMREVAYGKWREYNPNDAIRFYALRLHEAGLIKSNPQKILAQGTDWRLVNELKRELKG